MKTSGVMRAVEVDLAQMENVEDRNVHIMEVKNEWRRILVSHSEPLYLRITSCSKLKAESPIFNYLQQINLLIDV
jgi:hypothetical protein